ncbi:hypothetical protein DSO57_1035545 [Entomophthora muscae]|uniref:Uncharacterized protein n=1 Tax=Entomophthora muscae TaxID=34485 RepID=A0ACC2TY92_9FUNG|nr:hypothetical protein DSO57_1035545 [Entomophthora muscae]
MHFLTIFSIATASFANAGAVPNDAITDLLNKAEQVQKLLNFNLMDKSKFTKDDLAKVLPNILQNDNIKDLIVDDKISFSLENLSVPKDEANKLIVDAVKGTKSQVNAYIKNYVSKKTSPDSIEETKKEFRKVIEELSKHGETITNAIPKIDEAFTKHPKLATVINSIVAALHETFDKEGLDYVKLFLTEVKASHPELIAKLNVLVDAAQSKHNVFPEQQFNNLKQVLTGL